MDDSILIDHDVVLYSGFHTFPVEIDDRSCLIIIFIIFDGGTGGNGIRRWDVWSFKGCAGYPSSVCKRHLSPFLHMESYIQ